MYSSVLVFLLVALVASAMGGKMQEKFEVAKQKCIAETGIDPAHLVDFKSIHSLADDKCFYRCMFREHSGTFKADGSLDVSKIIAFIPDDMPEKDKMVAALTDCADKKGAEDCESAHQFVTCLHEKKKLPRICPISGLSASREDPSGAGVNKTGEELARFKLTYHSLEYRADVQESNK